MTRLTRSNRALLTGLGLSLVIHLGTLLGLGRMPFADTAADGAGQRPPPDPAVTVDYIPPEDPTVLGIHDSDAQTPNWLGFTDPTEHHAPESTTDQPALARNPGVGEPQDAAAPPAPTVPTPSDSQAPAAQDQPLPDGQPQPPNPQPVQAQTQAELDDLLARLRPVLQQLMNAASSALAGSPPHPPAPVAAPADGSGDQGEPSDKDSDPTAIVGTIDVVPGHPVARKGLEIKTVRPHWLNLTRMTARPNNPKIFIKFSRDGTVSEANFETGENTGYESVDGPLLDAIYAWKASGDALRRLPAADPNATLEVHIRVILR